MQTTKKNRHGIRADGIKVVSVPMSGALKADLLALAERDHRPLAAWVRMQMQSVVRRSKAAKKAA